MTIFRSGSTGSPAQTRRLDPDDEAVHREPATVAACHTDYVLGADERAAFDAHCRPGDDD